MFSELHPESRRDHYVVLVPAPIGSQPGTDIARSASPMLSVRCCFEIVIRVVSFPPSVGFVRTTRCSLPRRGSQLKPHALAMLQEADDFEEIISPRITRRTEHPHEAL